MSTDGIEALILETHNWGKTAKFLQALGWPESTRRQARQVNRRA
jgi:hypothetical protein